MPFRETYNTGYMMDNSGIPCWWCGGRTGYLATSSLAVWCSAVCSNLWSEWDKTIINRKKYSKGHIRYIDVWKDYETGKVPVLEKPPEKGIFLAEFMTGEGESMISRAVTDIDELPQLEEIWNRVYK